MRQNRDLPYHQLSYETNEQGGAIIHVSVNRTMPGVRSVLQGATHNASADTKVDHVPYLAPGEHATENA